MGSRPSLWAGLVAAAALALALGTRPAPAQGLDDVPGEALSDYVIGPGDLLEIDIFELEELSKTVRVTGDGAISYPMLGTVAVAGMTKRQLEARLAKLLEERYVRNPQVTVFLKEMQSGKVSVLGAVEQPGGFALVGEKSLLDALSQAGGVSRDAGTRAFLIRSTSPDPIPIDLRRLMEEADLSLNLEVAPGDVIYIPKARRWKVFVYGQVEKPGAFEIEEGDQVTALQAVSMAGGLARRAAAGKAKIVRGGEGGRKRVIKLDLGRVISGRDPDPELEEGDILVVPKSFF